MQRRQRRRAPHHRLHLCGKVLPAVHPVEPHRGVARRPVEQALGRDGFHRWNAGRCAHQGAKVHGEVRIVARLDGGQSLRDTVDPRVSGQGVLQRHPLHGVACRAAVGLRAEQRHVVFGQLGLRQQGGFVLRQALPGGLVLEVACFDLLDEPEEIDRRPVFVLDLVQQVHGRVVREETVLAVVEDEVLRSGREGHEEHEHHKQGGLGTGRGGVGQPMEQPGHVRL